MINDNEATLQGKIDTSSKHWRNAISSALYRLEQSGRLGTKCREREIDGTFLRDDQGRIVRLIVHQNGRSFSAPKQPEAKHRHPRSGGMRCERAFAEPRALVVRENQPLVCR